MLSPGCLDVCVSPSQLLIAWASLYETWYVHHDTWAHLNGVLHKSLPSVCVSLCVSLLSLLGNCSVRSSCRNEELLEAPFSIRSVLYERKVGFSCSFFPSDYPTKSFYSVFPRVFHALRVLILLIHIYIYICTYIYIVGEKYELNMKAMLLIPALFNDNI
jgi:hypothetical protein